MRSGKKAWMTAPMITVTMPELERRIRRFEAGEMKLVHLIESHFASGQQETVESDLKAVRQELSDMRESCQRYVDGGA